MGYYFKNTVVFSPKKKHAVHYTAIALLFLLLTFLPKISLGQSIEKSRIIKNRIPIIFENAKNKTRKTINRVKQDQYPITTNSSGQWKTTANSGWTSGFFPGILWILYEQSGNSAFKKEATKRQSNLLSQQYNTQTHDVGFILFESFGNGYRLTGNKSYSSIISNGAKSLSSRYSPKIGLIKSWDGQNNVQQTIVDNLMNLQLLFLSEKNSGDQNSKNIAINHALRSAKDFVRADGGTYHLINYDPKTGKIISKMSAQGFSAQSTWSRGQAWAIYGFSAAYRETRNIVLLNAARKTANYFVNNLPLDFVPYWDFNAPQKQKTQKDSSAAAIAASGLLDLANLETSKVQKDKYTNAAENILLSLTSKEYLSDKASQENILLHGTYNNNIGDYDTGTIWGDYYFLEALLKYSKLTDK